MLGTQLSVVASVKAVCPDKHETDDALVTNAGNLIDAVSNTLIHTEACCIKDEFFIQGLKPKPEDGVENSDGHEAIKLAASWKRRLDQKRKHAASHLPVDSFGLRKTTLDRGGDASLRDYLKTP
ncbi:uncharacterized protein LOC134855156 isoform X1 [Symsagittifera roscoffensis]|uniref:uncharacterized protein LOC134855156 isoform X1 n=1 Tax=Symsagittifera roscoffensis TaxID=84072 RepID=UPI00307B3961